MSIGLNANNDGTGSIQIGGSDAINISTGLNVGIGTASPTAPLDVNGNVAITGSARRITGDFSNATLANRVMFQNSVTNATTNIQSLPNGTSVVSGLVAFANSDPTNTSFAGFQSVGTEVRVSGGITGTGSYPYMTFYTGGSERIRIDSSGNVGIGTNSPGKKLDVFNSGTTTTDFVVRNGTVSLLSFVDAAAAYTGTGTNHPLLFTTNNTERMRIDTSGNVGIGTTAVRGGTSVNALSGYTASNNGVNIPYFQLYNANAGANLKTWRIGSDSAGALIFETVNDAYSAATERMRIDSSGNVLVTNAAGLGYGTGSGGTVTQATNKSTGVTLNKPTGRITMNGAALAASTTVEFTFTNSLIASTDVLVLNISGNAATAAAYNLGTRSTGTGSVVIGLRNITAGSLSEALVINFAIIKGVTA